MTEALRTVQETIEYTQEATKVVLGFAGLSVRATEVGQAMDTLFKAAAQRAQRFGASPILHNIALN